MQNNFNDDGIWDELDEADFEKCILLENEILSQNPSTQRKPIGANPVSANEFTNSVRWIDGKSSSFGLGKSSSFNFLNQNTSTEKCINRGRNDGITNYTLNGSCSVPGFKKQNFYKPLNIGISSSSNATNKVAQDGKCSISDKEPEDIDNTTLLKNQLTEALVNKAKLEEENLLKQGEVLNIRCELKRKETILETQRIDHCLALDAAEKRGKEKVSKQLSDAQLKIQTLEKELDKLQGNILFKSREVEELLAKCKQCEEIGSSTQNVSKKVSPSSKKRKRDDKVFPSTLSSSFINRFDFAGPQKCVKTVHVQTELEIKAKCRLRIGIKLRKGHPSGWERAFHLLTSSHSGADYYSSLHNAKSGLKEQQVSLLAQLISPTISDGYSTEYKEQLVNDAHRILQHLLSKEVPHSSNRTRKEGNVTQEENYGISAIPALGVLTIAQVDDEKVLQNNLKIVSLCIQAFVRAEKNHQSEINVAIEALTALSTRCSDIAPDTCDALICAMNECCKVGCGLIPKNLLSAALSFLKHQNFKRKLCSPNDDGCLLRRLCSLMICEGAQRQSMELTNAAIAFVASLLHQTNFLERQTSSDCSSFLLAAFVKHLYYVTENLKKDSYWRSVVTGVKVLHMWQCKDKGWWDKVLPLHSYTTLLSSIVKRSKYLRSMGILDQHTWELIYDLYEVEDGILL